MSRLASGLIDVEHSHHMTNLEIASYNGNIKIAAISTYRNIPKTNTTLEAGIYKHTSPSKLQLNASEHIFDSQATIHSRTKIKTEHDPRHAA